MDGGRMDGWRSHKWWVDGWRNQRWWTDGWKKHRRWKDGWLDGETMDGRRMEEP